MNFTTDTVRRTYTPSVVRQHTVHKFSRPFIYQTKTAMNRTEEEKAYFVAGKFWQIGKSLWHFFNAIKNAIMSVRFFDVCHCNLKRNV